MEVISRPILSKSRHPETQPITRSLFDSLPRGASSLPYSMAQQGYGFASGPSRNSQYDDRGAGRSEYDGLSVGGAPQCDSFGRSASYVDGSSLFPAPSASSYDHTNTSLRTDSTSHSLLNVHSQPQHDSQTLGSYQEALPHQAQPYGQYTPASAHAAASSQAYQHHQPQHHHHHHVHHPSDQHMGLQIPSDLVGSQPLGVHHAHSQYGLHSHPDYTQSSLDAQRKVQSRAEPAEPHTPRPPNAWILYRSQKFREIQQNRHSQTRSGSSEKPKSQAEISRIISQLWQSETAAVKQKFEALADEKKLAHQRMYPTYRYRPKKKAKNTKQNAAAQQKDQREATDGYNVKREAQSSFPGGHHDRYTPESSTSSLYSVDRKSGVESQRQVPAQSIHELAGRELMSRKANYGDRRDRTELQVPMGYGRSVSGSVSSGEGHSTSSYNNNRMHPYGDRSSSSLMRQESPRPSDVFGDAHSNSSTYTGSHWPESDAMNGSSSSTYFDSSRGGSGAYNSLGARLPAASLISNAVPSMLSLSPPQRQSVPSQQLEHPLGNLESNLNLAGLTGTDGSHNTGFGNGGGGGGFRTTPLTNQTARFGSSFGGEARSEVPSGLAGPGGGKRESL